MNTQTQCARILAHLQSGKELTNYEAFAKFGTTSLHRRLSDLRENGVDISDKWVKRRGKRFKSYFVSVRA